ncbi:acyl-CoA synthetase [Halospeciosus flavus]|uniref:Acyl-CoA synthetase n=1 Tax=Halospeciosus flavus TaxID=3032283 RepID=A0ABD5Z0J4_9EURY|nr:AMP-binding protein [Halospeciosus flavus]
MAWHVTLDGDTYEAARESFSWDVPEDYNIARDCLRKHEDTETQVALYQAYPDGRREIYTFAELDALSNQVAHALASLGVGRGDRVATVLSQKPATPLTHFACWKLGAVVLPLSVLFGEEGLRHRLDDSGATVVVTDADVSEKVAGVAEECDALEHVVEVDGDDGSDLQSFESLREGNSREFDIVETSPDTPALVLYTSGSTGPPKGVLHTHDVWVGHCPAFQMYFERDLSESVCWTPADWAWIGSLGDLVYPSWHYGRPVVGYPMGKFDAETAFELAEEFDITDAFLPPTAIRMMMDVDDPESRYDLDLKAICSGGEPLTPEILEWADTTLDSVAVNELYGQTEANLLVTNCRGWFEARPGSMGKPVPGHDVVILDTETGEPLGPGEVGEIAVRREGDPVVFEEYWNQPEKTEATTRGEWHLTGDLGERSSDGYIWFKSRTDDVIITSGYRVGPGEVESAILEHADVAQVGVVGIPDETRGEIIKAFVQPVSGVDGDDALREEIQDLVRDQLAKYEYPREIEFVSKLPQTTTGKIQRSELRERELDE